MVLGSYIAQNIWKEPSVRLWFRQILFKFNLKLNNLEREVLSTYSTDRSDYLELIHNYLGKDSNPLLVRNKDTKKDLLSSPLSDIRYAFRAAVFVRRLNLSRWQKINLLPVLSIGYKIIDALESFDIKCEKYVAFNSSYLIESFLSYYFRIRGVMTFSLQHGMYYKYQNKIPIDIINYENVCAEVLLTWGRYSSEQINEFLPNSSRALIYGYPLKQTLKKKILNSEDILIVLPRSIYWDLSKYVLERLKSLNVLGKFILRPHPSISLNVQDWLARQDGNKFCIDSTKSLSEAFERTLFSAVIGFNTTAVFQALLHDQNIIIYESEDDEFENPGFKSFSRFHDNQYIEKLFDEPNVEKMLQLKNYFFQKVAMNLVLL